MVKFARPSVGEDMVLVLPGGQPGGRFCFLSVFSFFEKLTIGVTRLDLAAAAGSPILGR